MLKTVVLYVLFGLPKFPQGWYLLQQYQLLLKYFLCGFQTILVILKFALLKPSWYSHMYYWVVQSRICFFNIYFLTKHFFFLQLVLMSMWITWAKIKTWKKLQKFQKWFYISKHRHVIFSRLPQNSAVFLKLERNKTEIGKCLVIQNMKWFVFINKF